MDASSLNLSWGWKATWKQNPGASEAIITGSSQSAQVYWNGRKNREWGRDRQTGRVRETEWESLYAVTQTEIKCSLTEPWPSQASLSCHLDTGRIQRQCYSRYHNGSWQQNLEKCLLRYEVKMPVELGTISMRGYTVHSCHFNLVLSSICLRKSLSGCQGENKMVVMAPAFHGSYCCLVIG